MTPSFRCIGGTLLWGADHQLTEDDAKYLLGVFRDECFSAHRAGLKSAADAAQKLHDELSIAWAKSKDWVRASGGAR